jgi:hypothetical protein
MIKIALMLFAIIFGVLFIKLMNAKDGKVRTFEKRIPVTIQNAGILASDLASGS